MQSYRKPVPEKQHAEPEYGLEVAPGGRPHTQPTNELKQDRDASQPGLELAPQVKQMRNPLGLSPFVFGLLVAAVTAIIVGAAVGGGVGSQIHSSSSPNTSKTAASTTTKTITTTTTVNSASATSSTSLAESLSNYTVAAPNTVTQLDSGCPSIANGPIVSPRGDEFVVYCYSDMPVGSLDPDGRPINDIVSTTAYRFEDCVAACSNYNYYNGKGLCQGVSYRLDLINFPYANCFLHNGSAEGKPNDVAMHGVLQ